jgi:hypothetical protein
MFRCSTAGPTSRSRLPLFSGVTLLAQTPKSLNKPYDPDSYANRDAPALPPLPLETHHAIHSISRLNTSSTAAISISVMEMASPDTSLVEAASSGLVTLMYTSLSATARREMSHRSWRLGEPATRHTHRNATNRMFNRLRHALT